MTCRIDRLVVDGILPDLRISGRIEADDVNVLRVAIDHEPGPITIDLEEVSLVDRSAVNLLAVSEARGIELRNCPAYIREWIDQERPR